MRLMRSPGLWIAVLCAAIAAAAPWWVSAYILGVLTSAYYFGVFAMSWDLLFGFAGEVNFGPTFLIGLGAYGAAILDSQDRAADPDLPRLRGSPRRARRPAARPAGAAAARTRISGW